MRILIFAAVAVLVIGASSLCRAQEPTTTTAPSATKQAAGDVEQMRKSVKQLTTENDYLRGKVAELERRLRNHSIRDRMMQEEQRAENLEEQLFSIAKEEANLQAQLEEVNEQLRPENIEQLQVSGSLRPEGIRESARRRLTNRQSRIQAQLQLLDQSRSRIQSSISVTDMLIQNLRMQMQAAATHP
jgi:peptidoglycan hydrolase CwlO-like protein